MKCGLGGFPHEQLHQEEEQGSFKNKHLRMFSISDDQNHEHQSQRQQFISVGGQNRAIALPKKLSYLGNLVIIDAVFLVDSRVVMTEIVFTTEVLIEVYLMLG